MAERDFKAVDAIDCGIAGRGAAQGSHLGVRYETHVHQMVLDIIGQIECDQDAAFANRQIAENAHLTNPAVPAKTARPKKNTTGMVVIQYTAKLAVAAIMQFGNLGLGFSHDLTSRERTALAGSPNPSQAPWRTL